MQKNVFINLFIYLFILFFIFFSKTCIIFYSWVSQFEEGMTSVGDKPRQESLAEEVPPTKVANEDFVNKDHRVALQEVASQFSIGKASAHNHIHETLGMRKASGWRNSWLTEDQTASRMTIAKTTSKFHYAPKQGFQKYIWGTTVLRSTIEM